MARTGRGRPDSVHFAYVGATAVADPRTLREHAGAGDAPGGGMSDASAVTEPSPLDPDPERRAAAMRTLRAEGGIVPMPGVDGVLAAVRYDAVSTGLGSVNAFGGSAGQDGIPEEDVFIAAIDEPRHGKIRRIINSVVAFHKSQQIEPYLEQLTERLLDAMLAEARTAGPEGVNLVRHLAGPIPPAAMARLVGFPEEDSLQFAEWAKDGGRQFQEAAARGVSVSLADVNPELRDYVDGRIEERLASPQEEWPQDALTRFLITEVEGERLDPRAIRTQIMFMIGAGTETTRNTMGSMFFRLGRDPEAYAALRADPSLIEVAVEEALRVDSPAQFLVRTCREPTRVSDTDVEPNQRVFMCIGSANRDDAVFEGADEYRLDREKHDHLAFGTGPHICPGAALARLELRTALRAFSERVISFHLAEGYEYDPLPTAMLQGPRRLPIVIDAEASRA
jgi:cytochrome P450